MTWTFCDCHNFQLLLQRHTNTQETTATAQALIGSGSLVAALDSVLFLALCWSLFGILIKHEGNRRTFGVLMRTLCFY
jgi:hypothetical protein